jgi:hypothetical protein
MRLAIPRLDVLLPLFVAAMVTRAQLILVTIPQDVSTQKFLVMMAMHVPLIRVIPKQDVITPLLIVTITMPHE